jgi:hypothetical protein
MCPCLHALWLMYMIVSQTLIKPGGACPTPPAAWPEMEAMRHQKTGHVTDWQHCGAPEDLEGARAQEVQTAEVAAEHGRQGVQSQGCSRDSVDGGVGELSGGQLQKTT